MLRCSAAPSPSGPRSSASPRGDGDPALQELRRLLLAGDRTKQAEFDQRLAAMEQRWEPAVLAEHLGPALAPALRHQMAEEREIVVESLLPMVGDLVHRAVSDAIQDLAATVDSQLRRSLDGRLLRHRLKAWLAGGGQPAALRLGLHFHVREILLVHQDTGLLLCRWAPGDAGPTDRAPADAEAVSGMLTAIQDFARDVMRAAPGAELGEVRLGEARIQRCNGQRAFLAVIAEGEPPVGYRHLLRETLRQIERRHQAALRSFTGATDSFRDLAPDLATLAVAEAVLPLSRGERWALRLLLLSLLAAALAVSAHLGWLDPLLRWGRGLLNPAAKVIPFE